MAEGNRRRRTITDIAAGICLATLGAALPLGHLVADEPAADGRDVYVSQCARCHQRDGRGVDGLYPSLRTLADLWDDRQRIIRTVLAGRTGVLDRDGARFHNVMPAHGFLGNETVASTLSYVLARWGPGGRPFTPEEVAAIRLDLLSRHPVPSEPVPGASPLADMTAIQYVTTEGPALSVEDFDQARRLYYGRCTGCHGVMRQGTAGNPLTPDLMRDRGTEYLRSVISYGSSTGMPGWGTSETLSAEDINRLALFLQHPVPQPPDMDAHQIRDGWRQQRILSARPEHPRHAYDLDRMFAVALHDVGEVALIDGVGKSLITRVPVGRAPHRIAASSSGRYLYVICRDGTLSLVDLYADPPERVASVRIGYEARAVAASRYPGFEDRFVMAGAYWPPQLVLLDGQTLEPLRLLSTRSFTAGSHRYHPEPRVTDIAGSPAHPEFITQIKETGHVYLFPYDRDDRLAIRDLETVLELRAGSFSVNGRYYLTPADSNAVSVLDVERQFIVTEIPARVFGGNAGISYVDPQHGPVWASSSIVDDTLVLIGTDPDDHPEKAWRVVRRVPGPASGSLFLATHPASPHLWMDTPLAARSEHSQGVAVFAKNDLAAGYRTLPVARWSGLLQGPRRVIQPAYSADGSEVWLLVWNPQDRGSAIVVIDDATLEPIITVRDPTLITPTRIYSVAALRSDAGAMSPKQTQRKPAAEPAGAIPDYPGADLYAANCANCHGTYGEGEGAMTPALSVVLRDLRYLSERNGGQFPAEFVREIVDGRAMRAAHGPEGMPVWGVEFARGEGFDEAAGARVEAKIDAIVRLLEAMQIKP